MSAEKWQIAAGAHGPVEICWAQLVSPASMAYYWHTAALPGLQLSYRGHRDDLVAAGCVVAERLRERFDRFHDDGHGGLWVISSAAGPGKRGRVTMSYYLVSRALAQKLPGVTTFCREELAALVEPSSRERFGAAARLAADEAWLRAQLRAQD